VVDHREEEENCVSGFESQIPGGEQPRAESKGEAAVRLASWVTSVLRIFRVKPYPKEEEHLAFFLACIIRRWPYFATWKAPGRGKDDLSWGPGG
jgi:hypothetical protein